MARVNLEERPASSAHLNLRGDGTIDGSAEGRP